MKAPVLITIFALVLLCAGCVAPPSNPPPRNEVRQPTDSDVLEIVHVDTSTLILPRQDIVAALGSAPIDWRNVDISHDRLIDSLRRTRFGMSGGPGRREYADTYLQGATVRHSYTLGDLGARDSYVLLEKFFERRPQIPGGWWIRKRGGELVEENGLIELLKSLGFEARRSSLAPVLFVRPVS